MDPALEGSGLSGLACEKCHKHFGDEQENDLLTEYCTECEHCGAFVDAGNARLAILPRYQYLLNLTSARKVQYWYHATDSQTWPKPVKTKWFGDGKPFYAHIGSEESALDRARCMSYNTLYKVKINSKASWSPYVVDDDNYWPTQPHKNSEEENLLFDDVTRYVNRYEIPGSMSLLVVSSMIEVVEVTKIPGR